MADKNIKFLATAIFLTLILLLPCFSFAQELEIDYPDIGKATSEEIETGLPGYVRYIFNLSIAVAGFVLFAVLVRAGIVYLTAAGNPEKMKRGRELISSAFLGITVLLLSYLILTTINPQLVIFEISPLGEIKTKKVPPIPEWEEDEISLIVAELPLGQAMENGLWSTAIMDETKKLMDDNKDFLEEEIQVNPTFDRIADLNKYILSLTEDCRCEELTGLCIDPVSYRMPVGCYGDPCPEKKRDQIEKSLDINQDKIDQLLEFRDKVLAQKEKIAEQLSQFVDLEDEMVFCQQQSGTLTNLGEHISRIGFYLERDWPINIEKFPGLPAANADPLTFYCSAGGSINDYPYKTLREAPAGLTEFENINITSSDTFGSGGYNCPAEIPLGTVLDELRELAITLISKMERLAELEERMASKVDDMKELTSECTDQHCDINCGCIDNFCYETGCGMPQNPSCITGKCTPPTPATPNWCRPFCHSPCLQAVGGCNGSCTREDFNELSQKIHDCLERNCPEEDMDEIYQNLKDCPDACPRNKIMAKTIEIGKLESQVFETIWEINQIFPKASSLIGREEGAKISLKAVREAVEACEGSASAGGGMALVGCPEAIGNYAAGGQVIGDCHPRNFFCCLFSEVEPATEGSSTEYAYEAASKTYPPLPAVEGCPQGWLCEPEIKDYNQYDDASKPLKELLSCMRQELDKIIEERELKMSIGLISVISDPKLHQGTCGWETGPTIEGGCSHTHEIKYGKERVSAHYGGPDCRYMKKSYAVNFSDTENSEYLIEAAKKCRPDSFISYKTAQHYQGLHISLGQAEDCGVN